MPLPVYHLRRLLAATAVLLTIVVVGMYFYARYRTRNVLKEIPGKIGYDIKQTANGFQFSKSDGKRTLFTIQASDIKEFKLNGRAELHNVSIILYGRDSARFDKIYGDEFSYDPKTAEVMAKGEVQIDLVANPAGLSGPDQSTPQELKNPIHLKTRDLVFNKDTGNASTDARVELETAQATGWSIGVKYAGKSNTLTLESQIHVTLSGPRAAVIEADHGLITNEPREIVLDHPRLRGEGGNLRADRAEFRLDKDNNVDSVLATGDVAVETRTKERSTARAEQVSEMIAHADEGEFFLTGKEDLLRSATLTGHVHVEQAGPEPLQGDAGRVLLDFSGRNQLQKVRAMEGAHLAQKARPGNPQALASAKGSVPQDFELAAAAIDFAIKKGHILENAQTSGPAQITITPSQDAPAASAAGRQRTVVTAGRFEAKFITDRSESETASHKNHLSAIHGAPAARIVSTAPGQPDRVSTSDSVDARFLPQGGIESITQAGNFMYSDGQAPDKKVQAWASTALYTPADQNLILTGSPRLSMGAMATTANKVRIDRATGDAFAEGDVKSTYSDIKEQPDGALLASSSPIHVTGAKMTAYRNPGAAVYTGHARLWQDANIIEAPSIEFDRNRRSVTAQGSTDELVLTTLVQPAASQAAGQKEGKQGKMTPLVITTPRLTYTDQERRIRYEEGVMARGSGFTVSAKTADVLLLPHKQTSTNQTVAGPGQLDRMVAQGSIVVQQDRRRAEGEKLVYTAADDKFVLTGGTPSIFDAEQGKITGVSLTFFRRDDRVLVEGKSSSPVVTQTRVAR